MSRTPVCGGWIYKGREKNVAFNIRTVREIARLTEENQHIEALTLGAQMLGEKRLSKKLQLVGILCRMEGHVPTGIGKYRDTLYDQLMERAKDKLSDTEYSFFHSAY
jgi:hypothetical protein